MEWVLLGLAAAGAATWGGQRLRGRIGLRRDRAEALAQVVRLCEEDTTLLGEQLRRLDTEAGERPLDEAARGDYQAALDAYESAQRQVGRISGVEEISAVTDTLNDGRYALACVRARIAGEPVPEQRVPCYFNPQHGPSVADVMFTARAGGTKRVPACAQDAARIQAGERPAVRTVGLNERQVAYFEAGALGKVLGEKAMLDAIGTSPSLQRAIPGHNRF